MFCLSRQVPPFPAVAAGWFRKLAVGTRRSTEGVLLRNRKELLDVEEGHVP